MYSLIGTISVVGNFIVLFVCYKSKQLRHSQYVYNCSIALSDIVWGFTISIFFLRFFVWLLESSSNNLTEESIKKQLIVKPQTISESAIEQL